MTLALPTLSMYQGGRARGMRKNLRHAAKAWAFYRPIVFPDGPAKGEWDKNRKEREILLSRQYYGRSEGLQEESRQRRKDS